MYLSHMLVYIHLYICTHVTSHHIYVIHEFLYKYYNSLILYDTIAQRSYISDFLDKVLLQRHIYFITNKYKLDYL